AESYIECNNRQGFHNAHEFAALYPDDARASFGYCLPRLKEGMAELAAIRARLFERAEMLGHPTTAEPDLHLVVDGTIVAAQSAADGRRAFRLDARADEVWLASRCGVPAELEPLSSDRRCLGVCVQQLVLRDDHLRVEVSHSHPSLGEGFHKDEENTRLWTTGMGRIPEPFLRAFAGGFTIAVYCLPPTPRYSLHPPIVSVSNRFARSTASATRPAPSHARPRARNHRERRGRQPLRAAHPLEEPYWPRKNPLLPRNHWHWGICRPSAPAMLRRWPGTPARTGFSAMATMPPRTVVKCRHRLIARYPLRRRKVRRLPIS